MLGAKFYCPFVTAEYVNEQSPLHKLRARLQVGGLSCGAIGIAYNYPIADHDEFLWLVFDVNSKWDARLAVDQLALHDYRDIQYEFVDKW